jgi:hypothetical protein
MAAAHHRDGEHPQTMREVYGGAAERRGRRRMEGFDAGLDDQSAAE